MPKRRVRDVSQRRLGPRARANLRLVQGLQEELPYETALRETARRHHAIHAPERDELASVTELNSPPVFGDTVVLAVALACASCPTTIEEGAEGTYIDGELNCTECTWEARRG